jgi:hypothetical protein
MTIQTQLDRASVLSDVDLCDLLVAVAAANDAPATVYVYDIVKGRGLEITDRLKRALRGIEADRGRTAPKFTIPFSARRTLDPARRVHKICKGWRVSERNTEAAAYLEAATAWVQRQPPGTVDARSSAGARINIAKQLRTVLGVNLETARGVVTSLKRRNVL